MPEYEKAINDYYKQIDSLKKDGIIKETSTRDVFHDLVKAILPKEYTVIKEFSAKEKGNQNFYDLVFGSNAGNVIGTLEDKDEKTDLYKAVTQKQERNYDFTNILFQNNKEALLYQNEKEVDHALISNVQDFSRVLTRWVSYKNDSINKLESAFERFKIAVPTLSTEIHKEINTQYSTNQSFTNQLNDFLTELKMAIGEKLTLEDLKEMLVQHIMTKDLFAEILGEKTFNEFNTISRNLETLAVNLGRAFHSEIHNNITPYYQGLASSIGKMGNQYYEIELLRLFYEEFYKAYDPKKADTYGIVYTPMEVVEFMVQMSDFLLHKHFGKNLSSKGVHILDPCTGTGTFLVGLLNAIGRGEQLAYKYNNEIHANELSILAYYIGNIYVEKVYRSLNDDIFTEFKNMCFVDTLDNIFSEANQSQIKKDDKYHDEIFAAPTVISQENTKRIKEQNEKPLLLIIGNPPYNANQRNENQNNKNKSYKYIDERIKNTYVQESTAQKTKVYDMYTRFIRWASDRLMHKNAEEGIVAFVTNRSFLDAKGFDGFRKSVADEFTHVYTVDLGGDIRKGGMGGNIFNIMTGVAITFFVKVKNPKHKPGIFYYNPFNPLATRSEKLSLLHDTATDYTATKNIPWQQINPDATGNWITQSESNFATLPIELCNKENKRLTYKEFEVQGETLFGLYSLGVVTNRDPWVYDKDKLNLEKKVKYFIKVYNSEVERWNKSDKKVDTNDFVKRNIKWTSELENHLIKNDKIENIVFTESLYRPFNKLFFEYDKMLTHRRYQMPSLFPTGQRGENLLICITSPTQRLPFGVYITDIIPDLGFFRDGTQTLPLYRYVNGQKVSNLNPKMLATWATTLGKPVTDEDAFYYVYALLHHPTYRQTYALDLTQNLPRLPFIKADFFTLAALGKTLATAHLNFDTAEPYANVVEETTTLKNNPQPKLRSNKDLGEILIDENTTLKNIPQNAWGYKLGNRAALDWVLENYKEKKVNPDNGDVANPHSDLYKKDGYKAYTFAPYKAECIALLQRIITVSLDTQNIIAQIEKISLDKTEN